MRRTAWQAHRLAVNDHEMAWYETGGGQPLLFLHGSYDSLLLRPMAELFAHKHRCILYDQRGAGGSALETLDQRSLHVDRFLDDIESLRGHLGLQRVTILGHSWGATLGLLYGGRFPNRIDRLVLIGMGPFSDEMHAVYHANVLRMMDPEDRPHWEQVNRRYAAGRAAGDVPRELDERNIRCWAPVMFYSREAAERFVDEYLAAGGWRRHTPSATGFTREDVLRDAHRIDRPVMILYGYQDYEPIVQAFLLKQRIGHARLVFLNECGHMVWVDQPAQLVAAVNAFLDDGGRP